MNRIYISGHRNPDMDSVCAAYAYAALKKKIDTASTYIPIRCGALNPQTKSIFQKLDLEPPQLVKDIRPKVAEVARRDIVTLDVNDPIYRAIEELDSRTLSMIPVFKSMSQFMGTISIHEISAFLMNENLETRPRYHFITENIPKVLPGYFYSMGSSSTFTAPLMIGVMPYEIGLDRIQQLGGDLPLLVVGLREDLIQYAVDNAFPGIILTGLDEDRVIPVDLSDYPGIVYISKVDTAETTRLLRLSSPLHDIMNTSPPRLSNDTDFEEAKKILLNSEHRGLPVFEGERFSGIVTRRCFIEKPRPKLIMVDHNELEQSVQGADEAEILEIVDHHRIGVPKTKEPIRVDLRPLGSTCTIIYQEYLANGLKPDKKEAALMLSGILSDTVMLKSPTATGAEKKAIQELSSIAGLDWEAWGREMFEHAATLKGSEARQIVNGDFKTYEHRGVHIGIGQVEVVAFEEIPEVKKELVEVMESESTRRGLDWVLLLITNVLKEESILLCSEAPRFSEKLLYKKRARGEYELPGILSRKKQLLPEILGLLEEA